MANDGYLLKEGRVISVADENEGRRIKVRLNGLDGNTPDENLPYCFPLLPKLVHVYPQVGEMVLVVFQQGDASKSNRFYIGPVISQFNMLNKDSADISASNMFKDRLSKPLPKPDTDPENAGTLPEQQDIAILGRSNSDIILKDHELDIRCGIKQSPNGGVNQSLHFNNIDPAYIQLKYHKLKDNNNKDFSSVINVVADRINLLSRDSKEVYNLYDKLLADKKDNDSCGSDHELQNILSSAHPLPYGDELINFLKKFIELFRTHDHPFAYEKPEFSEQENNLLNTNLDEMLSKAIHIN